MRFWAISPRLLASALAGLIAIVLGAAAPGRSAAPALLVTSGEVTATGAVVWARGAAEGEIAVEVAPAGGAARRIVRVRATREADFTVKAVVAGLRPSTRYLYRVQQGAAVGEGEFTTAPPSSHPDRVTFLWSGDLGGGGFCRRIDAGYPIFTAMTRRAADFFLFAGDTAYTDVPCSKPGTVPGAEFRATTLPQYHARHRYNREDGPFQAFLKRTPVFATWDDHEIRNDFSGRLDPLPTARRAFLDYWPIVPPAEEPVRLYRSVRWGRLLEVFILDTRQYRDPNTDVDRPGKTMLGAAQRRWVLDGVVASDATWKVVVSTVPLSIPTGRTERRDSWTGVNVFGLPVEDATGFATERDAILRELAGRGVKNLVFAVADVHHAELVRHEPVSGFVVHEMIAGPLSATHGRARPLDESLNPRSLFAQGGVNNFGEVTIDATGLTVRFIDEQGGVMGTHLLRAE